MTDEQILQNAEQHVIELFLHGDSRYYEKNGFVAGAHSRDEEIKELEEEIESLKENEKELFEGFKKRGTKLGELMKENVKLRNQWRDAKKDPPKREIGNKICYTFVDMTFDGVHEQRYYHYAEFKKYGLGNEGWVDEDGDRVLVEVADYWMPIPETPKGGKE